jgi:hypothetical protein
MIKECEFYQQEELVPSVKFIWNPKTKKLESDKAKCKGCGEQREVVREPGPIGLPWFKAENARNYNNKKVRKYDFDHSSNVNEIVKMPSGKKKV